MSARVIKSSYAAQLHHCDAFNLTDIRHTAEQLTATATHRAAEIVAQAQLEAQQIREHAASEARSLGLHEGLREATAAIDRQADKVAEQRVAEELLTALPALRQVAASLAAERDRWIQRWEETAIRISVAIAEKLLQRQLLLNSHDATNMIGTALRLAAGQQQLTIYLNSADLRAWGDRASQMVQSLTACAMTTFIADDHVARGGCRIETQHGEIDATVQTMLQRIVDELTE